MLNQHSLEEIADIYNLLEDIKKEYNTGIKPISVSYTHLTLPTICSV